VLENGSVAFDLAQSKESISGDNNRRLLHLWSAQRNAVWRILQAKVKSWRFVGNATADLHQLEKCAASLTSKSFGEPSKDTSPSSRSHV